MPTRLPTLVVDLDGTLLHSDLLYESLWSAISRDWKSPFRAVAALSQGRAMLKRYLADNSSVDVTVLPYNTEVIQFIEQWRQGGGRTALVTASDEKFAHAVAEHLGVFDEVHGSDGQRNLKGECKGQFLEETFGHKGFAYIGDAAADIAVWRRARLSITVNASSQLRRAAERVCESVQHLGSSQGSMEAYARALRPHQWLKNILVFLPLLAAHQFDTHTILAALMAFVSFNLIASGVYVLNDLLDLSVDRAHPRKRNRPFASGSVPIAHGTWLAALLVVLGTALAASQGERFLLVIAGYFTLTCAYSLTLKRRLVIDICVLAGLYTTRIVAGGVATGISLSVWLLAFAVFFFFSLAAVKRQAELIDTLGRGNTEARGRGYHVDDLPIISMVAICAGYAAVLVLILYVNSPAVANLYSFPEALWGVCAVLLYWITHTVMVAHRGHMHDDPVVYAAKNRISRLCFAIILMLVLAGALL